MGLSRHLVDGGHDKEESESIAQNIFREAFDLDFQLNNIFIEAEIEAGESPVGIANIEVENFINRIIDAFSHKMVEKELKVEFSCEGDGALVFKTDPLKLHAILMNIMANAVEFCLKGKGIKVSAARKEGALVISMEDQGIGIANEEKERIFDRFRQLEAGTRKGHRGHGLGLSIVKSLLTHLGGHVDISGVAGEGCICTVSIPEFEGESEVDVFSEEGNEFIFGTEEEF